MTTLSAIAQINPRLTAQLKEDDPISFLGMADVSEAGDTSQGEERLFTEVKKGYTPFLNGDLLVAKITPCFENGKIAQARTAHTQAFGSTEFHVVRVDEAKADPRFILHLLRGPNVRTSGAKRMTGSAGQKRVPKAFLETLDIPLPPLPEQRRIADILDRADDLRAQRRRAISLLDSLEDAIFVERFGDPVRDDDRWERVPLSALGASRLGKMLDAKAQTGKNPKKYLRNANVQWFRFDLDHVLEMDFEPRIQAEYRLEPRDVLVCEGGQPGRSAIWRGEIEECYFQKALHRVRLDDSKLLPEYFVRYMWLLSRDASFGGLVTSATIAHLTGEKLATLPIVVPPMDMQRQYRDQTEAIDRIRQDQLADLERLDELFASLQHRAFHGEL